MRLEALSLCFLVRGAALAGEAPVVASLRLDTSLTHCKKDSECTLVESVCGSVGVRVDKVDEALQYLTENSKGPIGCISYTPGPGDRAACRGGQCRYISEKVDPASKD